MELILFRQSYIYMEKYWTMAIAVPKTQKIYNSMLVHDIRVEEMGCLCGCCNEVLSAEKESELIGGNHFLKEQIVVPYIRTSYLIGSERIYEQLLFSYAGDLKEIKTVDK